LPLSWCRAHSAGSRTTTAGLRNGRRQRRESLRCCNRSIDCRTARVRNSSSCRSGPAHGKSRSTLSIMLRTIPETEMQALMQSEFEFSEDWFSNHIPSWRRVLERLKPGRVLEIGSYEGRSTCFVIETCSRFGALDLTCVDTWAGSADLPSWRMTGVERR